jgi:hypothetical protein
MRKFAVLVPLFLVALLACSQKGFNANVHVTPQPVPGVDFSTYRTWDFGLEGEYPLTGLQYIDQPQFRVAVAKHFTAEMQKLGYTKVDSIPDLVILMHVASEVKFDQQKMDDIYKGYDMAWSQMGAEDAWNEGTLMLFAMDAKTGKQMWSSTAQAKLQDYVTYDERLDRFNKVLTMMLGDFPMHMH